MIFRSIYGFKYYQNKQIMKATIYSVFSFSFFAFLFFACNQGSGDSKIEDAKTPSGSVSFGGFDSQLKWGEHLVLIGGCNDCHTPKKMGPNGPEDDKARMLSGHPAEMPAPDFNVNDAAKKGLIVTQTFTAWTGPWGTTYAANLTPDPTGLGHWKEEQFIKAIKEKKWMGLDDTRPLMPPMSMMPVTLMSDDELKAIFAYLQTIPAIQNKQPEAVLLPPPAPVQK